MSELVTVGTFGCYYGQYQSCRSVDGLCNGEKHSMSTDDAENSTLEANTLPKANMDTKSPSLDHCEQTRETVGDEILVEMTEQVQNMRRRRTNASGSYLAPHLVGVCIDSVTKYVKLTTEMRNVEI